MREHTLADGRVGVLGRCRGANCREEIVFVFNPKSGRRPPFNLDGSPHFATCKDADDFRDREQTRTEKRRDLRTAKSRERGTL